LDESVTYTLEMDVYQAREVWGILEWAAGQLFGSAGEYSREMADDLYRVLKENGGWNEQDHSGE
jgi:hypothetical protein